MLNKNKIFAVLLAALLCFSGCGSKTNTKEEPKESLPTEPTIVEAVLDTLPRETVEEEDVLDETFPSEEPTEDITHQEDKGGEALAPANNASGAQDIVNYMKSENLDYVESSFDVDEKDSSDIMHKGAKRETSYKFANGDKIVVLGFENEEYALKHISGFSKDASFWEHEENGESCGVCIDYIAPVHKWLAGREVITYCSMTGDFLPDLNKILGTEVCGAGSNYYLPPYAEELRDVLSQDDYYFNGERAVILPNYYIKQPVSICALKSDLGEVIYMLEFASEDDAIAHESAYSEDGLTYTGVNGVAGVKKNLDRDYPVNVFRRGNVVIEYSSEKAELLPQLKKLYPKKLSLIGKLAGIKENSDYQTMEFETESIRTDGYVSGAKYPRYAFITSREELDSHILTHSGIYSMSNFSENTKKYDEKWFESHDMVLLLVESGSGSVRYNASEVRLLSGGGLEIIVDVDAPEIGTCDMAEWHILVGIGKKIITAESPISTNIGNAVKDEPLGELY